MLACIWQSYRHMAASRNNQTVTVVHRTHKAVSSISRKSPLMKHQKMRQETTEIAGRGPGLDLWFYHSGPSIVTVQCALQLGERSINLHERFKVQLEPLPSGVRGGWQRSTVGPLRHTASWTYATVKLLVYPGQY
jgi:hypothetical protein